MIPITRIDEYLAVISQDEDATGLPDQAVTRIDTYLSKIAGEAVAELPEPVTRIDRYLASIAGMDVVMDDPITRIDYYLATVAGVYSGELPEPVTRIDHYLYQWAQGGGMPDWQTFTGNPLQFTAPKAHTLKSATVEFTPKQDLHGYANPWPAGGGANKWDEEWEVGGIVNATGLPYDATDRIRSKNFCKCDPSTSYYVTKGTNVGSIYWYDSNKGFISYQGAVETVVTSPNNAAFFKYVIGNTTTYGNNLAINYPSSVTTYSPYSNICPISGWDSVSVWDEPDYDPTAQPMTTLTFPSTVYGGTASVAEDGSGVGSDTWKTIKLSSLTWTKNATGEHTFYGVGFTDRKYRIDGTNGNAFCTSYKFYTSADPNLLTNDGIALANSDSGNLNNRTRIYLTDLRASTKEELEQILAQSEAEVCCLLATPVPFTPTASAAPTAVVGVNTMWTDGDSLTVEARGEAVNLNALQSLNMLLGGRYVNNHTEDDVSDEEALRILMGESR